MAEPPRAERPRDVADVATFLRNHGWPSARRVERIAHGEWSKAFSFAAAAEDARDKFTLGKPSTQSEWRSHTSRPPTDEAEYVVRFSALEEDFRKDQRAAGFGEPRLPIPKLVALGVAFDGYYTVAERVQGEYLDALDSQSMRRVLPALLRAIDAMREADISASTGFGVWDATGHAPAASWREALLLVGEDSRGSRLDGWRDALARSPTGLEPFEIGLARLRQLLDGLPDVGRHLIHADLLNYNVLVGGEHVAAVLDWGSAMYGDWVFDIAWLTYWQPWYPAWTGLDFEAEARRRFQAIGLTVPAFAERLHCCELVIGLGNQTYCAFRGEERWPQLAEVAARTLALIDLPR